MLRRVGRVLACFVLVGLGSGVVAAPVAASEPASAVGSVVPVESSASRHVDVSTIGPASPASGVASGVAAEPPGAKAPASAKPQSIATTYPNTLVAWYAAGASEVTVYETDSGQGTTLTASSPVTGAVVFDLTHDSPGVVPFRLWLKGPSGHGLAVGTYTITEDGSGPSGGLGNADAASAGHFDVHEITYSNGTLTSIAASAALVFDGSAHPYTNYYELRYNSSRPWVIATQSTTELQFYTRTGTTSEAATVTVTATGTKPLVVSAATATPSDFAVSSNACAMASLSDGQSCAVSVTYKPATTQVDGTLSLTDNAYEGSASVKLLGIPYSGPVTGADTNPVTFTNPAAFAGASPPCTIACDTSVAAGPSHLMEVAADSIRIVDRGGYRHWDLSAQQFLVGDSSLPVGTVRVAWDSLHSRWLATGTGWSCAGAYLYLAVSDGTDPTGGWSTYSWKLGSTFSAARPFVGVSSDKVAVSYEVNDFDGCASWGETQFAAVTVVDSKTLLAERAPMPSRSFGGPGGPVRYQVAQNMSAGADLQVLGFASPGYHPGYARITGSVAGNNVKITSLADLTTTGPKLPAGLTTEASFWGNGVLWTAAPQTCTPRGATTSAGCYRVVGISTGTTPQKVQDFAIGTPGRTIQSSTLALAGDGSVGVIWDETAIESSDHARTVYASYRTPTDPANTMRAPFLLGRDVSTEDSLDDPWLGIAADPLNPRAFWATPLLLTGSGYTTTIAQLEEAGPARVGGASRFATAALTSERTFAPGVGVVYVANAVNFPDALAGAAAAGEIPGPILLANATGAIDPTTVGELKRLKPAKIIVLGGTGAISAAVENSLKTYAQSVVRYGGASRFATAAIISANTFSPGADVAYIANAFSFPDALAGAAAAGTKHGPVLLAAATGTLDAATANELTRLQPKRIIVLGGTGAIGDDVVKQLKSKFASVVRYSGSSRFATAVSISQNTFTPGVSRVYLANAYGFADALAGAAAAGTVKGPILLVPATGTVDSGTIAEITRLHPTQIVVLGGTSAVSDGVLSQLLTLTTH